MADLRLTPVTSVPITAPTAPRLTPEPKPDPFGATLRRALAEVNDLQLEAGTAAQALATGQTQDMTQTVVTIEKANIAFQFALQIRNKLLEAYQEVMRTPV